MQGVEIDASKCSASCSADDAWLGVRGRPGVLKGLNMEFLESRAYLCVFSNLLAFPWLFHLTFHHFILFPLSSLSFQLQDLFLSLSIQVVLVIISNK